jgi:hypothetical protein
LWDVEPAEGSVLKGKSGPYFPSLQREIDLCVGDGLVVVNTIYPLVGEDGETRIGASFSLSVDVAREFVEHISMLPDEVHVRGFLLELAFAFLDIPSDRRDDAALFDAAWSNPAIAEGRVVDFAEWVSSTFQNPTWNTAQRFQAFAPKGVTLTRAEKLLMYMRLMKRKANG